MRETTQNSPNGQIQSAAESDIFDWRRIHIVWRVSSSHKSTSLQKNSGTGSDIPIIVSISVPSHNSPGIQKDQGKKKKEKVIKKKGQNSPLPTTSLPPNIKRPHGNIREIKRRTAQTAHTMHHTTSPIPTTHLRSHINKTLNLAMHIAIRNIATVFTPLARKDTL